MIQRVQGYTDEEIQYIIDNYQTSTNKEIAKALNKKVSSITHAARMNGLIKQPHKEWTDEENIFLKENYETMTSKELAKALGRTKPSIDVQKERLGLSKMIKWSKRDEEYLRTNYLYMEHAEMGKVLNKTEQAVRAKCFDLDLIKDRNWEENEIEFVKNNYKTMATDEIAELLDRSFYSIQVKANRMGLKKSPYHCNYHYFDEINSEEKAYWLGFLTADGWISKNKETDSAETGMELQYGDINHLKKFNKSIDGNYRITDRWRECKISPLKSVNRSCTIRIFSFIMYSDLIKYGFTNKKSFECYIPNLDRDLLKHYIRGYFDGNGCVSVSNNHLSVSICTASKNMAEDLVNCIMENDIEAKIYSTITEYDTTVYNVTITKKKEKIKFLDYIYDDCNIYLDRKYKKYLKAKRIYDKPQVSMPHCLEINNH